MKLNVNDILSEVQMAEFHETDDAYDFKARMISHIESVMIFVEELDKLLDDIASNPTATKVEINAANAVIELMKAHEVSY